MIRYSFPVDSGGDVSPQYVDVTQWIHTKNVINPESRLVSMEAFVAVLRNLHRTVDEAVFYGPRS